MRAIWYGDHIKGGGRHDTEGNISRETPPYNMSCMSLYNGMMDGRDYLKGYGMNETQTTQSQ